jgi:hypothetical protein
MRSRPTGVLVIAIYYFLSGASALAAAIWLLMASVDTSRIPFGGADLAKYILLIAIMAAGISAGYIGTGWGLWQLRQWAQAAAIAVSGIALVFDFGILLLLSFGGGLVPIQLYVSVGLFALISLGIIGYLLTPGVASMFGSQVTMPVDTCPHCGQPGIGPGMNTCPYCRRSLFEPPADAYGQNVQFGSGGYQMTDSTIPGTDVALNTTRIAQPRAAVLGWLVVKAGPDAGRRLDLDEDNAIGRDTRCQITLNDDYVSRQHARVKLESGQFVIYDIGSSTGTFVNGRQVQRLMLYDGAEIRLGNTTMEFKKTAPSR